MLYSGENSEVHTELRAGDLEVMDHLKDLGVYGRMLLNMVLEK
jgi:hypothetical protein